MELIDVYAYEAAPRVLYDLLEERDEAISISHKRMPTWRQHVGFIASKPYSAWRLIKVDGEIVGSVYLTRQNEIGVFIFKAQRGNGYGSEAIRQLMKLRPRKRYLANINPRNEGSKQFFEALGFKLIQVTYAKE